MKKSFLEKLGFAVMLSLPGIIFVWFITTPDITYWYGVGIITGAFLAQD